MEKLLSADPVASKLYKKRKNAQVSGVTGQKKTRPTTGVELRFYKYKEFAALTDAQREELRELRPKGKGSDGKYTFGKGKRKYNTPTKDNNHWTKKQIKGKVAALVKEQSKKQKPDADAEVAELDKLLAVLAPPAVPVDSKIFAAVKL